MPKRRVVEVSGGSEIDNSAVVPRLCNHVDGLYQHPTVFNHSSPEGNRMYKRSIVMLLGASVEQLQLGPLSVEETIGDSILFRLPEMTQAVAQQLTVRMHEIIESNISIERRNILRSEALEHFLSRGSLRTAELVRTTNETHIPCYYLHHDEMPFIALSHGPSVPHTGQIDKEHFEIAIVEEPYPHFRLFHATKRSEDAPFQLTRSTEPRLLEAYAMQKLWASQLSMQTICDINSAISQSRITSLVQLSEASHDHQVVHIASLIGGRPGKPLEGPRPRLVLIAGPSSSGKTTFAKRLSVSLEAVGVKPIVISVDSYYKAWQDIDPRGMQHVDWEDLAALNLDLLNENLVDLLDGKEVLVPEYDMVTSMPKGREHWINTRLPTGGLIIMEGIHCLNPKLTPRVAKEDKFQIMISPLAAVALDDLNMVSSSQVRMMRRMVRDYLFRGRSAAGTLRQWPSVARGERTNIFPNQNNADVVMNSALMYEAHVLKVHAEPLLRSITPDEAEYAEAKRLLSLLNHLVPMPSHMVPPQSLLREFIGGSWFYDFAGWYKNA